MKGYYLSQKVILGTVVCSMFGFALHINLKSQNGSLSRLFVKYIIVHVHKIMWLSLPLLSVQSKDRETHDVSIPCVKL
jgi:hypothetical protein